MNLERFVIAQADWYDYAMRELRDGKKRSHWMWFIFPQIKGLGRSDTAVYFAISGREDAVAYLKHPILGPRLEAAAEALLAHRNVSAEEIFGYTDSIKLRSSMTLFSEVSGNPVFAAVLQQYYQGKKDEKTLQILAAMK